MKRPILLLLAIVPALAFGQAVLPAKKVVVSGLGRLSESEIQELRNAAPNINLVFANRDTVMKEIVDADALIGTPNRDQLRAAKKLQWVQINSAGAENVLMIPELKNSPIVLTNMKIVQGIEIADHALALLLALSRRLDITLRNQATETWPNLATYGPPLELQGKTAVIVGVGGIGTQIAIRAKAFGMTVIGVDPKDIPFTPYLDRTIWPDRLDTVLPEADVLFISAPHTAQTEKMIGAEQFAKLKKGAIFICVSRGKIYDAMALVDALKSKHVAAAGVDVTDPEPLPKNHPLWKMDRVIITPHIAGRSDGEGPRYFEIYKENLERFAKGQSLRHQVDKQAGY
jgi:phosphoglycerate dehydrogenase-like enzyme